MQYIYGSTPIGQELRTNTAATIATREKGIQNSIPTVVNAAYTALRTHSTEGTPESNYVLDVQSLISNGDVAKTITKNVAPTKHALTNAEISIFETAIVEEFNKVVETADRAGTTYPVTVNLDKVQHNITFDWSAEPVPKPAPEVETVAETVIDESK